MAEVTDDPAVDAARMVAVGLGAQVVLDLREVLLGQVAAESDGAEAATVPASASATNFASAVWASRRVPLTVLLRWTGFPSGVYPVSTRSRQTPAPRSDIDPFMPEQGSSF